MWRKAAKQNLVITTADGKNISFVSLWGLPIESKVGVSLNSLYEEYKKKLQGSDYSLIGGKKDTTAELVVALIEDVYADRVEEKERAKKRAEAKARLELLEKLKEEKAVQDLMSKDVEALEKEIEALKKEL
jgi:hypothetical protein